jgi:hypothetical protein
MSTGGANCGKLLPIATSPEGESRVCWNLVGTTAVRFSSIHAG